MKIQLVYCYRYIKLSIKQLGLFFRRKQKENTYVFHHLPRCGGTSLRDSIAESKKVYNDYRMGWGAIYPVKYPITKLGKKDCLSGHFELEGYHLFQRYPEIFYNKRFKLFTFIRNPLDLSISYYYYRLKMNQSIDGDIRNHLFNHKNYLAKVLNVTSENYKTILDRYDFIGIFEKYDESLLRLSYMLDNDYLTKKHMNIAERNNLISTIRKEDIAMFKQRNQLDFEIYNYCFDRFGK